MGRRTLFSLVAGTLLLGALTGTAWAHPAYKASDPPSGSSVSSPPTELWVEFTETIEGGKLEVFDPCGAQVDNGDSTQNLTNDRVTVTLSASMKGTYRVDWSVLGSDGHPTRGSFTFSVSGGEECPGEEPPPSQEEPRGGTAPREGRAGSDPAPGTAPGTDGGPRQERQADRSSGTGDGTRRPGGARQGGDPPENRAGGGAVAAPEDGGESAPTSDRSIWDGIPIGDLLIALAVAALIGAAGGRIYAGIMGPAPPK